MARYPEGGAASSAKPRIANRAETAAGERRRAGGPEMRCFCATAIPVIIALSLAGTGCKPKATQSAGTETEQVSLFKEGKGVWFSEETTKLFGLETGEVQERAMQCQLRKTGQVYRAAREGVPARAVLLLSASEAEELRAGQPVGLTGSGNGGEQGGTGGVVGRVPGAGRLSDKVGALIEWGDPGGQTKSTPRFGR